MFSVLGVNQSVVNIDKLLKTANANAEQTVNHCRSVYSLLDEYSGYHNGCPGKYCEQYYSCEGLSGPCSISGARTKFYYDRMSIEPTITCDETGPSNC